MNKYENSKIYKLVNDEMPGMVYYGSTYNTLVKRLSKHKTPSNHCRSKVLFEFGKVQIILVEKYPCNDIDELKAQERFYIENNECLNKVIPGRTDKEYYQDNKDQILLYQKEHYQANKEQISLQKKEYYEANKEKIALQHKEYKEANKEKLSKKYDCECGGSYTHNYKATHFKTKTHLKYLDSL